MAPRPDIMQIIEENQEQIEEWLRSGLTMKQIASNLGISARSLSRSKDKEGGPLGHISKRSRAACVKELENTMFTSAKGYERKVKKYAKLKRCVYDNGKKSDEWEDMVEYEETEYYPPDTTAGIFLLKNWGKYSNEPQTVAIRKKEVELKERQIDANSW